MWTGSLSFGLVNVPVKMYTATENHSISFHQVHAADGGRIKMKRFCTECGKEVAYADMAKGYETEDGRRVILRTAEFKDLPRAPKKEIEVLEFVPDDQVDPILFDKSYYLEPDGRALKPYVLLRSALQSTERTAIVRIAIRERTQLGCLRIHDDVLVLQTMLWPDEVRVPDFEFLAQDMDLRPQELQMAQSLIANLSADFEPDQYTDDYREAILALIEEKLSGGESVPVTADGDVAGGPSQVVDLMSALRASVAETNRPGSVPAQASSRRAAAKSAASPRKRSTAKKATTRAAGQSSQSAARKSPAKKSAAGGTEKKATGRKAPAKATGKRARTGSAKKTAKSA